MSPPATTDSRAAECLAYGVACGAESTQHFGAGAVDPEQVERIRAEVEVRELEVPAEASERPTTGRSSTIGGRCDLAPECRK